MKSRLSYKAQARKNYSSAMIRYALFLRYNSLQCYKLLLEKFRLPSISLLNKIQNGGVHTLKDDR